MEDTFAAKKAKFDTLMKYLEHYGIDIDKKMIEYVGTVLVLMIVELMLGNHRTRPNLLEKFFAKNKISKFCVALT